MDPIIRITPAFKGMFLASDLLQMEGTLTFSIPNYLSKTNSGVLFHIQDVNGFIFIAAIENDIIRVQRNDGIVELNIKEFDGVGKIKIFITWSYEEINIFCNLKREKGKYNSIQPSEFLIDYIYQSGLLKRTEYLTLEDLRSRVYECLSHIEQSIQKIGKVDLFWDLEYSGNKIINKKPKKEVNIHQFIQYILYDRVFLSGITVIPELTTGVGNLDFAFCGYVTGKGISKICVECKPAHSDDLIRGLEVQLPEYLINQKSEYGAYCVLDFGFPERSISSSELLTKLNIQRMKSGNSIVKNNIRIFVFDLTKKESASKK